MSPSLPAKRLWIAMVLLTCVLAPPARAWGPGDDALWTRHALDSALGDGPYDGEAQGEAIGWRLDTGTFGFCAWTCEDRMSDWKRTCLIGRATGAGLAPLEPVTPRGFVNERLARLPSTGQTRFGACEVTVEFSLDEELPICSWSARVRAGGRTSELHSGWGSCLEESEPRVIVAPDGKAAAVVVAYSGDHGCGDLEGFVMAVPGALQERVGTSAHCAAPRTPDNSPVETTDATDWSTLLSRHGEVASDKTRVRIVVFNDFQCPFGQRVISTLNEIKRVYGEQVQLVFLHNPLPFRKDARHAAIAAVAAAGQGRFRALHDILFDNQHALSPTQLEHHAARAGLDMARFRSDRDSAWAARFVDRSRAVSVEVGSITTPGFFVNGRMLEGAQPVERFKALIDEERAASHRVGRSGSAWLDARTRSHNATLQDLLEDKHDMGAAPPRSAAGLRLTQYRRGLDELRRVV